MIRKFCFTSTILLLIFALSTVLWSEEIRKPDYMKEKEEPVKKEARKEEEKKPVKSERTAELEKLSQQLKEMQAKMEDISADSDEGKNVKQRIREIQRRITQLKARSDRKMPPKRLSGRNSETHIKELRNAIAKDKEQIAELKETNPDSPKLKQLQDRLAERQKEVERLTAQHRRARAERTPVRRVAQTQLRIFKLKHIDAKTAFEIVEPFVKRDKDVKGVIVMVAHTKSLIVKDTQRSLLDVETIIKHIDVEIKE